VSPSLVSLLSDPIKIRMVLKNLVHNALRFTGAGQVSVVVRERGALVELRVSDTGVGIAAAQLEHIFEPFYQVQQESGGGAGLGLYIVQRLVDSLGGKIEVESEVGRGTTFSIFLPGERAGFKVPAHAEI
jgi:signal transduction histidine kinase